MPAFSCSAPKGGCCYQEEKETTLLNKDLAYEFVTWIGGPLFAYTASLAALLVS
jgi:hypothetical protein